MGTIVELRIDETVNYCLFFFFPIYFCKRLIAFSCKYASQREQKYVPQNFICYRLLLVIVSLILTCLLQLMFLIFNVILKLRFLFPFCNTVGRNLSGFTIIQFTLNHFITDSDSFFKIFQGSPLLFASIEIVFPDGIYLPKFNNRNTRTWCEIYSKLTTKIPEQCHQL